MCVHMHIYIYIYTSKQTHKNKNKKKKKRVFDIAFLGASTDRWATNHGRLLCKLVSKRLLANSMLSRIQSKVTQGEHPAFV